MSSTWWAIGEAEAVLGPTGRDLIRWIRETISKPNPALGRPGPMCPYVPAALRNQVLFGVIAEPDQEVLEVLYAQSERFISDSLAVPDSAAELKSVLVLFPGRDGVDLRAAVDIAKARLIEVGLTCGEFYPDSEDRSARTEVVRVARAPVPLIAIRFLTPHDELFLGSHPEYGPKFREWMLYSRQGDDALKKSGHAVTRNRGATSQLTHEAVTDA